jgi:hypothetical protein
MFGLSIFLSIKGRVTETTLHFWQPTPVYRLLYRCSGISEEKSCREALCRSNKKAVNGTSSHQSEPCVENERDDIKSTAHLRCEEISQAVSQRRIFLFAMKDFHARSSPFGIDNSCSEPSQTGGARKCRLSSATLRVKFSRPKICILSPAAERSEKGVFISLRRSYIYIFPR